MDRDDFFDLHAFLVGESAARNANANIGKLLKKLGYSQENGDFERAWCSAVDVLVTDFAAALLTHYPVEEWQELLMRLGDDIIKIAFYELSTD